MFYTRIKAWLWHHPGRCLLALAGREFGDRMTLTQAVTVRRRQLAGKWIKPSIIDEAIAIIKAHQPPPKASRLIDNAQVRWLRWALKEGKK